MIALSLLSICVHFLSCFRTIKSGGGSAINRSTLSTSSTKKDFKIAHLVQKLWHCKWEDAYWWVLSSGGVRTRKVCYQQGYTIWFLDAQTSQERAVIKTSHVSLDFPELPVLSNLQDFPNIPKFLILLKKNLLSEI